MKHDEMRREYRRPLYLALIMAIVGEVVLLVLYGFVLFPEGDPLTKVVWTLICALGMGAVTGALVALFVVAKLDGLSAIWASTFIWAAVMGIACNALCFFLGREFSMWGAHQHATLFLLSGFFPALGGGLVYSYLLFTERGQLLLSRMGL